MICSGTSRGPGGACVPEDACGGSPCGATPCFAVGSAYRCGCPAGYGWDAPHAVCLQVLHLLHLATCSITFFFFSSLHLVNVLLYISVRRWLRECVLPVRLSVVRCIVSVRVSGWVSAGGRRSLPDCAGRRLAVG